MRYFLGLCCLVLGLVALPAFAQPVTINGVPIEAIGAGKAYIQPDGSVIQSIGFKATPPGATQPSYYQRAVQYTKGTVGGNVKQFAKFSAYSLLFTGILNGMGWVLDEITGDIYPPGQQGSPALTCNPSYHLGGNYLGGGTSCTQSGALQKWKDSCHSYALSWGGTNIQCNISPVYPTYVGGSLSASAYNVSFNTPYGPITQSGNEASFLYGTHTDPAITGTPATNEQVAEQVAPKLDPDTLDKLATHPETGAVKQTQEVLDKMTELANQLAKQADPTKTDVAAPTASPTANTTDVPASAGMAFPSFCIWAKAVCDWFDWTREPPTDIPDPEMPETDFNGVLPYNSGLGYGQCPADKGVNLSWAPAQSFSYEPFCQLAIGIKPLVIASAGIFALFILSGYGRGRKGG